jgi:hypothetical protein
MFVSAMSIDHGRGGHYETRTISNPSLEGIEEAIGKLDGDRTTLVMLATGSQAHMAIGGGKDAYIVYVTFNNQTFYSLSIPAGDDQIKLVVGGQEGEYPASLCVSLEKALAAARTFATSGELDRSLSWIK